MTDIVSPILQWLNNNPHMAGLATFAISAGESVAIIGTVVPGSIMMTALGALAGAGVIPLWSTIFWAIIGAIVGDGISYWMGHYFKDKLHRVWPFRRYPTLLKSGEAFVLKYGAMSVFIGRFVGPVRALVPLAAGMLGMKPYQFYLANIASAIGWAPAYLLPGILLGAASQELPPDIAIHVILVLLLIGLFVLLCMWFIYKILQLMHIQIDQMQTSIWDFLKKSPTLKPSTFLLKHYDSSRKHGQLNLFFYFVISGFLFLILAWYVKSNGAPTLFVNDAIFHLFRGIRSYTLDTYMLNLTLLGQKQVILPVVMVVFVWLMLGKRWRAALHALAVGVLAAGSVYVFKNIIQSPRPWGILQSPETFSMPSGHVTLATTVFMGYAFLIAGSLRAPYRKFIYLFGLTITLLVSISRLYLGAHWFTDVLASWLLSAAVLLFVIISYERKRERPVKPVPMTLVCLLALGITFSIYHYSNFHQMRLIYTLVRRPAAQISVQEWWQKNNYLPAYHASLFGFPTQRINVEWMGELDQIRETLIKEGWTAPPARDFISTLHRIADVKSNEFLPMISPQYQDRKPSLILVRKTESAKGLLALRLWEANRVFAETNSPLWVGVVGFIPRSYSWLFNSRMQVAIDPALIFPNKTAIASWEWKIIILNKHTGSIRINNHKIMLIRPNKPIHRKI